MGIGNIPNVQFFLDTMPFMDTFSIFQHQINLGANVLVQVPYFQVSTLTRFTGTEQESVA